MEMTISCKMLILIIFSGETPKPRGIAGQLARLIRRETGFVFNALVRRYDGLPFTAAYILDRLTEAGQ